MSKPESIALHVSRRLYALEGETRINFLRLAAVAMFYVVHLINRFVVGMSTGASVQVLGFNLPVFDTIATALAIAWACMAAAVLFLVRASVFRKVLAPVTTLADVGLLTAVLMVGTGPASPLIVALFLIIFASALRGNRPMVWLATVSCVASWAATLYVAGQVRPDLMPPRYHRLVIATALFIAGVLADLAVGATWRLAQQHLATFQNIVTVGGASLEVPPRGDSCPWCGAPAPATGPRCPRCEQPLAVDIPFRTEEPRSLLQTGPVHLGWSASVAAMLLLCVAIAVALAFDFPALVIPWIGVSVLMLAALARMLQLDLRVDENDRAFNRTAATLGGVAATLALSATALIVLVGVMVLVFVAAGVVVFALCMAVVAGSF